MKREYLTAAGIPCVAASPRGGLEGASYQQEDGQRLLCAITKAARAGKSGQHSLGMLPCLGRLLLISPCGRKNTRRARRLAALYVCWTDGVHEQQRRGEWLKTAGRVAHIGRAIASAAENERAGAKDSSITPILLCSTLQLPLPAMQRLGHTRYTGTPLPRLNLLDRKVIASVIVCLPFSPQQRHLCRRPFRQPPKANSGVQRLHRGR